MDLAAAPLLSQLDRLNRIMAAGPDGVSPSVLKACVDQLCGILQHFFNLILNQEKVPVLFQFQKDVIHLLLKTIDL